ncbi:MAG TPA: CPBP family intramembrane glutamic endopeptidase [Terriglobales bacterium]|nr:CPBP family intramembrane glutamic endopeptidase [Terriglobales bacterium]
MASDFTAPAPSLAPAQSPSAPTPSSRKLQFCLVIAIAFGMPVLSSLIVFIGHRTLRAATPGRTILGVIFQLVGLLCLYLVLRYQKRGLSDIGVRFPMRIDEVGHAFGLFLGAFPVGFAVGIVLLAIYYALGHPLHRTFNDSALFGTHITGWTVLFVLLNPFHEELIVRGFLITEMEHFHRNTALAVFVSVFLQSSYHLYQGLVPAILHASTFLLFSIYFVKTRRILPVVMAHMFLDVSALMVYAHRLAK